MSMFKNPLFRSISLFLLMGLLLPLTLLAQNTDDSLTREIRVPYKNGHGFINSAKVTSPFINSQLYMGLGFGVSANFTSPLVVIDNEPIVGVRGSLLFAQGRLQYQQRVRDWLAVYVSVSGTGRLGTNLGSLLVEGVSSAYGFRVGWRMKVFDKKKWILSTSIGMTNLKATFISLSPFLQSIGSDSLAPISTTVPALYGTFGVQFAYAFSPLLGLTVSGSGGAGESFDREVTRGFYKFEALLDFNLLNVSKVPMGLGLSYRITNQPARIYYNIGNETEVSLDIQYVGSVDYLLGVVLSNSRIPILSQNAKLNTFSFLITNRYFF